MPMGTVCCATVDIRVCLKILTTLGEGLSQARNRLQTAAHTVERTSFAVERVHLQVHPLTQIRSCVTEMNRTERVSTARARRRAD